MGDDMLFDPNDPTRLYGGVKGGPGGYTPEIKDGKVYGAVDSSDKSGVQNSTTNVTKTPVENNNQEPSAVNNIKGGPSSDTDPFANTDGLAANATSTVTDGEQQTGGGQQTGEVAGEVGGVGTQGAEGAGAPAPTPYQGKEVPTHSLEDRGRADDSVIAGILKKAGIDAKDDAKRDRVNKIMASVGAGLNMLQAIANIGAASRSNGRFVGNIDVAKPLNEGILADRARRKERDTARQTAIDKRAAMLDAMDAEKRKNEAAAAQKALDWQQKMKMQSMKDLFTAAENEKKRKADAAKAEADRASREGIAAKAEAGRNARNAANIKSREETERLKRENAQAIAKMGKGSTPKVDSIYIGKDKDGKDENVNISAAIANNAATTGKLAQAWDKLKKHSQFEAFIEAHSGTFDSVIYKKNGNNVYEFEEIDPMIQGDKKPNAKILTLMQTFFIDHQDDTSAETEAIRDLFRQMEVDAGESTEDKTGGVTASNSGKKSVSKSKDQESIGNTDQKPKTIVVKKA